MEFGFYSFLLWLHDNIPYHVYSHHIMSPGSSSLSEFRREGFVNRFKVCSDVSCPLILRRAKSKETLSQCLFFWPLNAFSITTFVLVFWPLRLQSCSLILQQAILTLVKVQLKVRVSSQEMRKLLCLTLLVIVKGKRAARHLFPSSSWTAYVICMHPKV